MRELTRARETAMNDLRAKRQQISAFLLRRGVHYPPDKKTWGKMHINWLMSQKFEFTEERILFEELMEAMRQAQGRLDRLEAAIRAAMPDWSLGKLVIALMAMRGLDIVSAATIVAEVGDLSRFRTPRELMAYVGIVPCGGLHRRQGQAWSDHQDRQSAGATHASRVCLELSVSAAVEQRQTGQGRGGAASGSRDCLEGAVPP
jgi:transposase